MASKIAGNIRTAFHQLPINVVAALATTDAVVAISIQAHSRWDTISIACFCGLVTGGAVVGAFIGDSVNWVAKPNAVSDPRYRNDDEELDDGFGGMPQPLHINGRTGMTLGAFAGLIMATQLIAPPQAAKESSSFFSPGYSALKQEVRNQPPEEPELPGQHHSGNVALNRATP